MSGNWDEDARVPAQQLDADEILRALVEREVEFLVIGGLAVAAHGYERATKGVDIVPAPTSPSRRVDVMQWVPGIDEGYEQLRPNAIEDVVPGVGRVAFAGYDDLVTMKRTANRPEDRIDLERLESIRSS